jgi:hypothetical protein
MSTWEIILDKLESGEIRSAQKVDGHWAANSGVKEAILDAFRAGKLVEHNGFVDKHNLLPRRFSPEQGYAWCRVVHRSGADAMWRRVLSSCPRPISISGLLWMRAP